LSCVASGGGVSVEADAPGGEAKAPADKLFLNLSINQASSLSLPTFSKTSTQSRRAGNSDEDGAFFHINHAGQLTNGGSFADAEPRVALQNRRT
jgi:hypothetical protein